jgi:hypothetical protein
MPLGNHRLVLSIASLLIVAGLTTSCLVRRRVITRQGGKAEQALLSTDKETLTRRIAMLYNSVQTLNGTMDMVPALGSVNKGKVTEYKDVRAYLLFRRPAAIRIVGLYPVVRSKAFDMVSDGTKFSLYIPARNRFVVGSDEIRTLSKNKLENLRPQHFLEALVIAPVASDETPVLENFTDEDNAAYILHILRKDDGGLKLARNIWFDRLHLSLIRQQIFDAAGNVLTDARYQDWNTYDGVPFPKRIDIDRPQDEYAVVMTVVKLDINKPLTPDKFALERPPEAQLTVLGETPPAAAANKPEPAAKKSKRNR